MQPSESAFATPEFLTFARGEKENVLHSGLAGNTPESSFPFYVVNRTNELYPGGASFIVSPICLSGASRLDFAAVLDTIGDSLTTYNVQGGFLQTRDPDFAGVDASEEWQVYTDSRTNYRLPLGLDQESLIRRMKRDSRSRCRKILKSLPSFHTEQVDPADRKQVGVFCRMYNATAQRAGFPGNYRFSQNQFITLLKNQLWNLLLFYNDGQPVSGTVLGKVPTGFDYTFMAGSSYPDAGRVNLLLTYFYLENRGEYLDLGGGIAEEDSLARFKTSMGGEPVGFRRLRFVRGNSAESWPALKHRWP